MGKSIKEEKRKSSFSSHYANSDLWFILPAVIFIMSGLFFLSDLNERKGAVTGMAVYSDSAPAGYYWEPGHEPTEKIEGASCPCETTVTLSQTTYCAEPNSIVDSNVLCLQENGVTSEVVCKTVESIKNNKFLCISNQWKVCSNTQSENLLVFGKSSIIDSSYICDGTKWQVCNVTGKQTTDGTDKYVCSGSSTWIKCTNQFCSQKSLDTKKFDDATALINLYASSQSPQGDVVETSLDLSNNVLFYNVLSPTKTELYFKYKGDNYKVVLTAPNYYDGTAKLEVRTIDDTLKGNPADIKATNESFPYFAPVQIAASLEGDDSPEIYVNVYGYFTPNLINVLVIVNPKLELDEFGSGKVFLSSKNAQEFILGEKRSVYLMETQGNYILFLDKKQYTNQTGIHYLEGKAKSEYVTYSRFTSEGLPFAVVQLTKSSEGIKNTYEESFSLNKPIKAGDKLIKICADDTKSLKQSLEVCDKDENKQFSLQNKGLNVVGNTLYWYLQPAGDEPKEGKAFYLAQLPLGGSSVTETANTFSNNLVQGKRLALDVDKSYYLLSHAIAIYLDFPSLMLTELSNKDLPQYKAEGDQEKIVFNLPLKRQVNIKLNFEPNLNFELSSKTVTDNIVNLIDTLQTSLSTYGSVQLTSPTGIGSVAVDTTDIATLKDKMKIAYGNSNSKKELIFQQPIVLGSGTEKALFYYNSFTSAGLNTFIKYADIYLYYNLTLSPALHTFDDEKFILPLVKGRKIAFGLEGNYYLLSYSEPWTKDSASGFSAAKMVLTSLDGATKYDAQATEDGIAFDVGKRKIKVVIDTNNNLITFTGVTAVEAAKTKFNPAEDFSIELPASTLPTEKNVIEIEGVGKFYNCDTPDTKKFGTYFLLCQEGEAKPALVKLNEPILLPGTDSKVILWYKGKSGSKKTIAIQHLANLSKLLESSFEWDALTELLKQEKSPVFAWENQLLELAGDEQLETFNLRLIPSGENYLIQMHSTEEGHSNGTIVVNDRLLFFQQDLKDFAINLSLKVLPYKLLTNKGVNLTSEVPLTFMPTVGAPIYTITTEKNFATLGQKKSTWYNFEVHGEAQKELDDDTLVFKGIVPAGKSRTVLLANGEQITVEVLSDENEEGEKVYTPVVKK